MRLIVTVLGAAVLVLALLLLFTFDTDEEPGQSRSEGERADGREDVTTSKPPDATSPGLGTAEGAEPGPGNLGASGHSKAGAPAEEDSPFPPRARTATSGGRVVDAAGKEVPNAVVWLRLDTPVGKPGPCRLIRADGKGRFRTPAMPLRRRLRLAATRSVRAFPLVFTEVTRASEDLRLVARTGDPLIIRIKGLDRRAAPAAKGVRVQVVLLDGAPDVMRIEAKLGADGTARVDGLGPKGHYVIHAGPFESGFFAAARWDTQRGDEGASVEIPLRRGREITGWVMGRDGDGRSAGVVAVNPVWIEHRGQSDEDGFFRIAGLDPNYAFLVVHGVPSAGGAGPDVHCRPGDRDVRLPLRRPAK